MCPSMLRDWLSPLRTHLGLAALRTCIRSGSSMACLVMVKSGMRRESVAVQKGRRGCGIVIAQKAGEGFVKISRELG